MIKVLFVCLGNICRSPMAEGIFQHLLEQHDLTSFFKCDSAGTSDYHISSLPDERMRKTAAGHGLNLTHRGRQISVKDLDEFDYILAMDSSNFKNIKSLASKDSIHAQVKMMRDFDPEKSTIDVPDPYYGGQHGFEEVYEILWRSNVAFLNYLKGKHHVK